MLLNASADAMAALSSDRGLCLRFDYSSESMTGSTGRTERLENGPVPLELAACIMAVRGIEDWRRLI